MAHRVRFALAATALLLAGCPESHVCTTSADCVDGDATTTDTCSAAGICEHTPACVGDACASDPCSPAFPVEGGLRVAVLDVGQGDSIAIVAPSGCAALVDGGPSGSGPRIKSWLHKQGATRIDFALASHYHSDHVGGLDEVEEGSDPLSVTAVYDRGDSSSTAPAYEEYAAAFSDRRQAVKVGDSWTLCDEVCFQVVGVNAGGSSTEDENALSVVLRMRYGPFTMLLGGDLTGDAESNLKAALGPVDVYKVHHHGSATSSTASFLAKIRPSVSMVSVGWDNSFGHPSAEAVGRIKAVESGIWLTEDSVHPLGDVQIDVVSATTFLVSQGTASVEYVVKGQ